MKIKIISPDGLTRTTRIIDADTGYEFRNVIAASWSLRANEARAIVTLELVGVDVEITGDADDALRHARLREKKS